MTWCPVEPAHSAEASRFADRRLTDAGIEHEFVQQEGTHCGLPVDPVLEFLDAHLVPLRNAQPRRDRSLRTCRPRGREYGGRRCIFTRRVTYG